MEKVEFFINRTNLEYASSERNFSSYLNDEYEGDELPSVFYLNLKYKDEIYLPLAIFQNKLTPLQVIVKYLKENLSKTNKQIASLLNRDPKAIWITYKSIKDNKPLLVEESDIQIPLGIFKDRRISILEALVQFLKNLDLRYSEIARLLKKDQRTIWTVYSRVKKKLGQNENKK